MVVIYGEPNPARLGECAAKGAPALLGEKIVVIGERETLMAVLVLMVGCRFGIAFTPLTTMLWGAVLHALPRRPERDVTACGLEMRTLRADNRLAVTVHTVIPNFSHALGCGHRP